VKTLPKLLWLALNMQDNTEFLPMLQKGMPHGHVILVLEQLNTLVVVLCQINLAAKMFHKLQWLVLNMQVNMEFLPTPPKEMLRGPKTLVREQSSTRVDVESPRNLLVVKTFHKLQ